MSGDPEFEDFLKRRRPLFRGDVDDGLEPPVELDRIVLRQARAAIEDERPLRMFGMPRWAAPVAIAATLVIGVSIVFRAGVPVADKIPEVRVENVSQRIDYPPAEVAVPAPPPPPAAIVETPVDGPVVVDLGSPAAVAPTWRRDAQTWKAEIERLRATGDRARADAELAEFNRQFRAYATSPDR